MDEDDTGRCRSGSRRGRTHETPDAGGLVQDARQPFQDPLRETKRDALLAFLKHNARTSTNARMFHDTADIYSHFLIDPEMSSCQLTSRIKQASASVQLLVQRCLMRLERDLQPDAEAGRSTLIWDRWEWMKNYRVWEANRKIFLYPENWIEPELRDSKSPPFKTLEDQIISEELTENNIDNSIKNTYIATARNIQPKCLGSL